MSFRGMNKGDKVRLIKDIPPQRVDYFGRKRGNVVTIIDIHYEKPEPILVRDALRDDNFWVKSTEVERL